MKDLKMLLKLIRKVVKQTVVQTMNELKDEGFFDNDLTQQMSPPSHKMAQDNGLYEDSEDGVLQEVFANTQPFSRDEIQESVHTPHESIMPQSTGNQAMDRVIERMNNTDYKGILERSKQFDKR